MMSGSRVALFAAALVPGCASVALRSNANTSSTFMLVSGVTAQEQMCLVGAGGAVFLDACSSAIHTGDGRELWSQQAGGQLLHLGSKMCASSTGAAVALTNCDGASAWKMQPNGQLQRGEKCLSHVGVAAGVENVAVRAAATASSSVDSVSHGAVSAVDADDATFWASKPGADGPTTLTMDLGEARSLSEVKISWEFPAQAFEVSSSVDGETWSEAYATTVNMIGVSRIPMGQIMASKVRITMHKAHPLSGDLSGQPVFGIKSLAVFAPRLQATLEDCATASRSKDARDKYFANYVPSFDLEAAAALGAELPALAAAEASLSTALSDLVASHPSLKGCQGTPALAAVRGTTAQSEQRRSAEATGMANDADLDGARLLLASAKSAIVSVREALY